MTVGTPWCRLRKRQKCSLCCCGDGGGDDGDGGDGGGGVWY